MKEKQGTRRRQFSYAFGIIHRTFLGMWIRTTNIVDDVIESNFTSARQSFQRPADVHEELSLHLAYLATKPLPWPTYLNSMSAPGVHR